LTFDEFVKIRDYIYRKSGIFYGDNKQYFVEKRVRDRMAATGHQNLQSYFLSLRFESSNKEWQELINALTVNETYFFREYPQLKCFAEEVIPSILKKKEAQGQIPVKLKIWSAGCSTGEEPYTLAIILEEMTAEVVSAPVTFEIHATDINTDVLDRAKTRLYNQRSVKDVPHEYMGKYFRRRGQMYELSAHMASHVKFYQLNLLDSAAMERMDNFDAIFCRNVLIYFDDNSRREVALYFHAALAEGGYMFLGHSESMSRVTPVFKMVRLKNAIIYQK